MSRIQNPCREVLRGNQISLDRWKKTRDISELQSHAIYSNTITPRIVALVNTAICREFLPQISEIIDMQERVEHLVDRVVDLTKERLDAKEYFRNYELTFYVRWNLIWFDNGVFAHDCCKQYTDNLHGVMWKPEWQQCLDRGYERCCDIFRDAVKWGPELPRITVKTQISQIAEAIYNDRSFHELGILADCMEESGDFGDAIIADCRRTTRRHRGYWLTDFLTGRRCVAPLGDADDREQV